MRNNNKDYILLAGYRRFNAAKKLGWKKVQANVYNEEKVIDLAIDDIEMGDNSRKDESSSELTELMASMKQNGLIQPVVVAKKSELTEEDFIALNLTENIQRKDLTPLEISIRLKRLTSLGLNNGEIAVRMGMSKERVRGLLDLGKSFDEKHLKDVEFSNNGIQARTKGKLSYTIANQIARARVAKVKKEELIQIAKKQEMTLQDTEIVTRLINLGMTVKQATKNARNFKMCNIRIPYNVDVMKRLCVEHKLSNGNDIVYSMLVGKIPVDKKLFDFGDGSRFKR